ncbi:MAG: FAD-dependent oxidoreductase [Pseudomonadales bacterium]|nr:FAD-dependent oxidoreductase [Pseudomonadales bacterium]
MKPTDIENPEYFHKVVDCQWACPAHTPVPEYIRQISAGNYTKAYMINWESNVFPGVLGRTCDRPCEPACRRGRIEEEPVAICRLKRVAADNKAEVKHLMPQAPKSKNGKRLALIGGGPASLTVARDLIPLGYEIDLYDDQAKAGGMMRSQIPAFRLPVEVLDEEVNYVVDMGLNEVFDTFVESMKDMLTKDYDAIFVGTGAPRGSNLDLPGREEASKNIHVGIDWLSSVAFGHVEKIGKRVLVLGGGNTAMDCCRTSRRLGGIDVKVVVRSEFSRMKASPWEIEDAVAEDIPVFNNHVPLEFVHDEGKLVGVRFQRVDVQYDANGKRNLAPLDEDPILFECDDVLIAIGQENAFPWIERDLGIEFGDWDVPKIHADTFQSTRHEVFFGGDAAFGPENIITAVAHGHQAAISIDLFCRGESLRKRPPPGTSLVSQKMGIHEWSYGNDIADDIRYIVPHVDKKIALADRHIEVELGFELEIGLKEAERCLNCDVQTVFTTSLCIECDACMDVCPTDCINFTDDGTEKDLRGRLRAPAKDLEQDLYASDILAQTGRIMIKDEDVCLHCGLCVERCPTGAWDMQKFLYEVTKADQQVKAKRVASR